MCIGFVAAVAVVWCAASPAAAAPAAGPGGLALAPATAPAGSTGNAFTFTYTAPKTQSVSGVLLVSAPKGFTTPQVRNPALPGFVAVAGGNCPAAVIGTSGQTIALGMLCRSGTAFSFTYAGRGSKVTVPQEAKQYAFETSIFVAPRLLVQLQLAPPIVSVVSADRTPPVISVSGVADGQVSSAAALTPAFSATDDNLASVAAILDGAPFLSGSLVGAEGAHVLVVTASDQAGNTSTLRIHFTLDRTPPAISLSGVSDGQLSSSPVSPSYTATDANLASLAATLDGAPFTSGTTVAADGPHLLVVTAADLAGNTATTVTHFTIDTTPPTLSITSPADGAHLAALTATVSGDAHDASPIALTVNGVSAPLAADGSFTTTTPLRLGANTIVIAATDAAGNTSTLTRNIRANDTPPTLTISAPTDGTITAAGSATVTGNVQPGDLADTTPVSVTVNGDPAPVAADGTFSVGVSLAPGANAIHIIATDGYGLQATATLTVTRN